MGGGFGQYGQPTGKGGKGGWDNNFAADEPHQVRLPGPGGTIRCAVPVLPPCSIPARPFFYIIQTGIQISLFFSFKHVKHADKHPGMVFSKVLHSFLEIDRK